MKAVSFQLIIKLHTTQSRMSKRKGKKGEDKLAKVFEGESIQIKVACVSNLMSAVSF